MPDAAHASIEEKQYNERSIAMRHQGKSVKRSRFVRRGKQILDKLQPDHNFLFSNYWFERFENPYNLSLGRTTYCSQNPPRALEPIIKKFHSSLLRLRNTGKFEAFDLANMDQTPLLFVLEDGKTFDKKGMKEVSAQSEQLGLDKRQATVQLTVFADKADRVRPTVFRGKGLRISAKEKLSYDRRVKVKYQEKRLDVIKRL